MEMLNDDASGQGGEIDDDSIENEADETTRSMKIMLKSTFFLIPIFISLFFSIE
jgi:uncharacterized protein Yka (UPF0111/DUF47 family)